MSRVATKSLSPSPYEHLYLARGNNTLWGPAPGRLVSRIHIWANPGGSVLDAGCGDGKNALFLEQQGFRVLGFDISETAISLLKHRASCSGHTITGNYMVANVVNVDFRSKFDVVVSYGLYHCIATNQRQSIHQRLQNLARANGIILFCCLTSTITPPANHFNTPISLPTEQEVLELFTEYQLDYVESGVIYEDHLPIVGHHRHSAIWIVARKDAANNV